MKIPPGVRSQLSDLIHSRQGEFDLRSLIPEAVELLADDEMRAQAAFAALKEVVRADDPLQERPTGQGVLFEYVSDRVLAVGGGYYCPMAQFEVHQARRRRELVTRNYKAVARRWQSEDDYWEKLIPQLEEHGGFLSDIEE
jgi:hypothetical protein